MASPVSRLLNTTLLLLFFFFIALFKQTYDERVGQMWLCFETCVHINGTYAIAVWCILIALVGKYLYNFWLLC